MKIGASIACAYWDGYSATFDELNKFFTISGMPIASSQYWNSIYGLEKGEAELDDAIPRSKHGLPDEEHCSGQGAKK